MNGTTDIATGLRVPLQIPLDSKQIIASEALLSNLGIGDNLAYTYYDGLVVTCLQERTNYEWRQALVGEIGLLPNNFVYPANWVVFGKNYSLLPFNFFDITLKHLLESKLDKGEFEGDASNLDDRIFELENINIPDAVLKYGEIVITNGVGNIAANTFNWRLNKIEFLNTPSYNFTIAEATDGFYRTDLVVGNNTGHYVIITGEENEIAAAEPAVPEGMIKLTLIPVFGSVISPPVIVPNYDDKFLKRYKFTYKTIQPIFNIGPGEDDYNVIYNNTLDCQIRVWENGYYGKYVKVGAIYPFKSMGTGKVTVVIMNNLVTVNAPEGLVLNKNQQCYLIKDDLNQWTLINPRTISESKNDYSGTVRTDVDEIDPIVYVKETVDTLLESKADLVGGKVPSTQLPSYVDDVLEYANFAALPATGETGKIYVTLDDNKQYRWSGSVYVAFGGGGKIPYTAYIDTVAGNNSTAILGDASKPFLTDAAAYASLPTDEGNAWSFVFLCDNVTRILETTSLSRRIKYVCYNTGTINFSNFNGSTTPYKELYFDAPMCTLKHIGVSGLTEISCFIPIYINVKILWVESNRLIFNNLTLKSIINLGTFYQRNSPNECIRSGTVTVENWDSTYGLIGFGSDLDLKIDNLILNGNVSIDFEVSRKHKFPVRKLSGTGRFNSINIFEIDISKIECASTVSIDIVSGTKLTGKANPLFLGKIYLQGGTPFVSCFYGKIEKIIAENAYGFSPIIQDSTIFLDNNFVVGGNFSNWPACNYYFKNVEFIQTTNSDLITGFNSAVNITIYKTGFIKSSSASLGVNDINVTLVNRTINDYNDLETIIVESGISRTISITDLGKKLVTNNTNPVAITIPTNATIFLPIGFTFDITQQGTGVVTVEGSGISFISDCGNVSVQGETRIYTKTDTNTWSVVGNRPNSGALAYKTYFINTVTGNNSTGIYEDANHPYATIDYVLALPAWKNGDIIYLQNENGIFELNGQLPVISNRGNVTIKSDLKVTLDFSNNENTNILSAEANNFFTITIDIPNGIIKNDRNGNSGVYFLEGNGGLIANITAKEIYNNSINTLFYPRFLKFNVPKISTKVCLIFGGYLNQTIDAYAFPLFVDEFICLGNNASIAIFYPLGSPITINSISGPGSYQFRNCHYNIGNISTINKSSTEGVGESLILNFMNSSITTADGLELGDYYGGKLLVTGVIKDCTKLQLSGNENTPNLVRFVNFSANINTGVITAYGGSVEMENCSIKALNSIFRFNSSNINTYIFLKNSSFQTFNNVPLVTGGAGSNSNLIVLGVSYNGTMLSDQEGTGITVNRLDRKSQIIPVDKALVFKKAPNVNEDIQEIGDYCMRFVEGEFISANYLGGNELLLSSYDI